MEAWESFFGLGVGLVVLSILSLGILFLDFLIIPSLPVLGMALLIKTLKERFQRREIEAK